VKQLSTFNELAVATVSHTGCRRQRAAERPLGGSHQLRHQEARLPVVREKHTSEHLIDKDDFTRGRCHGWPQKEFRLSMEAS
jgi:hypothetical protein